MKRAMSLVAQNLESKSDKIRALLREGYLRTEVAEFLEVRYQHVRNVAIDAGIEGGTQRGIVVVPKAKPIPKVPPDVVAAGTMVEVYIAMPPPLEWNGLPVITSAGLEAGLIKMIQPPWNKMGVGT